MVPGTSELKKVNALYAEIQKGMEYVRSGDIKGADEVDDRVSKKAEELGKKHPDIKAAYERLQKGIGDLFANEIREDEDTDLCEVGPEDDGKTYRINPDYPYLSDFKDVEDKSEKHDRKTRKKE